MHYEWTGKWPANRTPVIDSVQLNGLNAGDNILLMTSTTYNVKVYAYDPDGDELTYDWELVPENKKFGAYAGQGETKPSPLAGVIKERLDGGSLIKFVSPNEMGGDFRMFVYVNDGHNHSAVANIPFHIIEE
jgi:hypothetical protein